MDVSLLAAKLHIPPMPPDLFHRKRLVELLNTGLERKLTVVTAPAGYGKTTLLSEWVESFGERRASERPNRFGVRTLKVESANQSQFAANEVGHQPSNLQRATHIAWLSLDSGDNDSFRFWSYLLASLSTLISGDDPNAASQFCLSDVFYPPLLNEEALASLINQVIVGISQDFFLILDDYHWIQNPLIHKSIAFLLDYSPARMHLVIASREELPLHLALLRARGQLVEIGSEELRFTLEEAGAFVHRLQTADLSSQAMETLHFRTEGWIAGLQLVMLSMRDREDAENFIQGLTGSHPYIADFLVEEVLERQPEPVRSFLLQTSILERMCAPLCDAILGDKEQGIRDTGNEPIPLSLIPYSLSREILDYLERTNLFIIPLDDSHFWYRYHHLFSDVLQDRLKRKHPERLLNLHRRAAEWFSKNGYSEDALVHWLAAGDAGSAVKLIEQNAAKLLAQGEVAVLLTWFQKLPEAEIRSHPWLSIYYAAGLFLSSQPQLAETFLSSAERNIPDGDPLQARDMLGHIYALRAQIAIGFVRITEAEELARRALEILPEENLTICCLVAYTLGDACFLNNDAAGAGEAFANAIWMGQEGKNAYIAIAADCFLARVKMLQGRLSEADRHFREAQQLVTATGEYRYRMMDFGYAWWADLRREKDELSAARKMITEAMEYFSKMRSMDAMLLGYISLTRIHQSAGDMDAAMNVLNKAQELNRKYNLDRVNVYQLQACQVGAWIRKGDLKQAALCMERWGNDLQPPVGFLHHLQSITLARLFLAQGKIPEALARLKPVEVDAESKGLNGTLIEVLVLETLAFSGQEDLKSSLRALAKALRLAEPEGYFRIFLDEGAPLAKLLYRHSNRMDENIQQYADKLLTAFQGEEKAKLASEKKAPQLPDTVETLSERELQILRLTAEGRSYQEIAQMLILAISTVQHYIKSLYSKLQVHSGLEAVAYARQLGILP